MAKPVPKQTFTASVRVEGVFDVQLKASTLAEAVAEAEALTAPQVLDTHNAVADYSAPLVTGVSSNAWLH